VRTVGRSATEITRSTRTSPDLSEIEIYLRESGCDMLTFVDHLASGFPVGVAFTNTLNTWDIYTLRNANLYADIRTETEFDSPKLLSIIAYLKENQS
jgi:hypothetical protein